MIVLLLATLACGGDPAAPPELPPVEAPPPAPDPAAAAQAAWTAIVAAAGTESAPRALMDHVDPEVLGLHSPLQVAQALDGFVRDWGRPALGGGAPAAVRTEGDRSWLRWQGVDPAGRPVAVHVESRGGKLLRFGVDPQPDRDPPVLEALEVSTARMAGAPPRGLFVDPATGQALVLPEGAGEEGQARVMVERVTAAAPLTDEAAWAALGPALDAALACYTDRLAAKPTLEGTLQLQVLLSAEGAVRQVDRQGDTLDLALDRCVRAGLSALTVAPPGADVSFQLLLRFSPPEPPGDPSVPAPGGP
ncbi:hypothetical protein L6R53_08245 [Myxococcota bacterium]|nr:hypothetical protein [Myxococcota bacterium]